MLYLFIYLNRSQLRTVTTVVQWLHNTLC